MDEGVFYRVALEYESAEALAEQVDPTYADGTDIDSLADDRFVIAEPDVVVFATIELASETDRSRLESRLTSVDLSDMPVEIGIVRGQIDALGDERRVVVTVRPEFDITTVQAEVGEYIRSAGGEVVVETVPNVARRDIREAYFTVHDWSAPAVARRRYGWFGRFKHRVAARFRSEGAAHTPFGVIATDAHVRVESPELTLTEVETPPSVGVVP